MPKILMWNIENFRIDIKGQKEKVDFIQKTDLIADIVHKLDPDFFVVLEVLGDEPANNPDPGAPPQHDNYLGLPIYGLGVFSVGSLLGSLRAASSDKWCLVPPRYLSPVTSFYERFDRSVTNEAIAVFFRSDRFLFTGPMVNYKMTISSQASIEVDAIGSINQPGIIASPYEADFNSFLPTEKVTIHTPTQQTTPTLPQNVLSGDIPSDRHHYPIHNNWAFHTRFQKRGDSSLSGTIHLVSFHKSRSQNDQPILDLIKDLHTDFNAPITLVTDLNSDPTIFSARCTVALPALNDTQNRPVFSTTIDRGKLQNLYNLQQYLSFFNNGSYPVYQLLKSEATDNIMVYPKLLPDSFAKVVIANELLGYPYEMPLPTKESFDFSPYLRAPKVSFDNGIPILYGELAIERIKKYRQAIDDASNRIAALNKEENTTIPEEIRRYRNEIQNQRIKPGSPRYKSVQAQITNAENRKADCKELKEEITSHKDHYNSWLQTAKNVLDKTVAKLSISDHLPLYVEY